MFSRNLIVSKLKTKNKVILDNVRQPPKYPHAAGFWNVQHRILENISSDYNLVSITFDGTRITMAEIIQYLSHCYLRLCVHSLKDMVDTDF